MHHVHVLAATTDVDGEAAHCDVLGVRLGRTGNGRQRAGTDMRGVKFVYRATFVARRDDNVDLTLSRKMR